LLAHEHVSPKLDLIAGVTDPESFPLRIRQAVKPVADDAKRYALPPGLRTRY
jgi:hypothetical protein